MLPIRSLVTAHWISCGATGSGVAEGIEQASQAQQLHLLGCGYGQGYLYGRPMPAESVDKFMSAWASPSHCLTR
jgi:sensor c-di-GMP phosphodiesterase-like protein